MSETGPDELPPLIYRLLSLRAVLSSSEWAPVIRRTACEVIDEAIACIAADRERRAQVAAPVAWLRNLTDPQPHAVTDLKYRAGTHADAGVEYVPVYAGAPVPLSDEQIKTMFQQHVDQCEYVGHFELLRFARAVLKAAGSP